MNREVAIPTRGNVEAVLAGLLMHRGSFDSLRIVTAAMPRTTEARRLIETFQHLGVGVAIEMQEQPGSGPARAQAIKHSSATHLLFLDDDAVLVGAGAIEKLHDAALVKGIGWSTPIIRFAQGFVDPPRGHTEIWNPIRADDPRLNEAFVKRGTGWHRVFDVMDRAGSALASTDQLCGACFYAERARMLPCIEGLARWPAGVPGNDAWLGYKLGLGLVERVFCYHFGDYGSEWDRDALHRDLFENFKEPSWTR